MSTIAPITDPASRHGFASPATESGITGTVTPAAEIFAALVSDWFSPVSVDPLGELRGERHGHEVAVTVAAVRQLVLTSDVGAQLGGDPTPQTISDALALVRQRAEARADARRAARAAETEALAGELAAGADPREIERARLRRIADEAEARLAELDSPAEQEPHARRRGWLGL